MYTRCPHCLTVFVVAAEQLKAAHGNVRCGTCLESFDAIPHLSDGPVPAMPAPGPAHEASSVANDRPASDVDAAPGPTADTDVEAHPMPEGGSRPRAASDPGDGAPEVVEGDGVRSSAYGSTADFRSAGERLSSTLDAALAATTLREDGGPAQASTAASSGPEEWPAADGERPGEGDDADGPAAGHVSAPQESTPEGDAPLPEVLREEVSARAAQSAARRRNVAYGIVAAGLLALLAGQYVFFMPEDAVRRYPQWRGGIETLCLRVGCVLPERRDPGRIRVVSRDVRVHPKIEGVMQIKATLMNAAPFRQPYPLIRFTLFNVNGQLIATRDFTPSEYLGRRVEASARLRPRTPFQVELDVLAPEEAAVSFEFSFI